MPDSHRAANVLDQQPGGAVTWTTVNAGEAAFPGVPTPLSWTWSWWPTECGIRGAFAATGSFPRAFAVPPDELAARALTIQHGNAAINLDLFRAFADGLPGGSGDDVERAFFGSVRPGVHSTPRRRRYPVVAARMPVSAVRARAALRTHAAPTDAWWRSAVAADPDPAAARALLAEAQARYAAIAVPHVLVGLVSQALYDRVRALCVRAGTAEAAGLLVPGGQEEGRWLAQLWAVAHRRDTLAAFLAEHGYHGPLEGELSSPSWRIDPAPLDALLGGYARRDSPAELFARREQERREAQTRLEAALPVPLRPPARGLLAAARAYMPLRESGRATFLRAYDVARHAARALGGSLVAEGRLDTEDDVFHLTFDELTSGIPSADARGLVTERRALREHYRTVELPSLWTGNASPEIPVGGPEPGPGPLTGQGVSAGMCEGTVRVVLDPADADDVEDGDVLVCRATDPSWATLFYVAGAVVTDIGGEMSHGAIVARELGLPAVVNTRDGTRRLRTGQRVFVDGTAGTVTPC